MSLQRITIIVAIILLGLCAWLAKAMTGFPSALSPPEAQPAVTRIDNIRLISMVPGAQEVQEDQSVLVIDGEITAVGPSASLATPDNLSTDDMQIINGAGRTLLPGLIDAHVHLWDEAELAGYLAYGVTTVRNMGGMPLHGDLIKRLEAGRILGPDLATTGPILNSPGPNQQNIHQIVSTAQEARAAVRAQYAAGYHTLKVYSNLYREAYEAIRAEAERLDMTIVGHTPEGVRAKGVPHMRPFDIPFEEVLDDGFTTIEHVESIVWHGLRDQLDEQMMRDLAGRIAQSGVVVTPTLIAHDNLVRVAKSDGAYLSRPGTQTLNPLVSRIEQGSYDFWSNADPQAREAPRAAFYLKATGMLHEAGVPVIAGTDAGIFTNIPGSSMTRELELLVEAGLTPYEALAAASVTAGPAIGFADRGQIAPGYRANLILLAGDPLNDISLVERPSAVMIGGVWLDEEALAKLHKAARQTSTLRTARRLIVMLMANRL
ncbi:Amidohydrolase [hydrothermal vent metagenome]|uniref:Amidohydrolase n=1 Tax=hydrothermal vent metagenome TaxID=652676 RepID=A0A3B0SU08_9ZZZZ